MDFYNINIYWSESDRLFIVDFPEFQGCKTFGETYEEAEKKGLEFLDMLVGTYMNKGWHLPESCCCKNE